MMVGTQSKPVPIDFLKINREVMIQTSFRYCNNFPQTIEALQAVSSMLRIWLQTSMITKMFSRHLWTLSTPKRKPIWLRALSR